MYVYVCEEGWVGWQRDGHGERTRGWKWADTTEPPFCTFRPSVESISKIWSERARATAGRGRGKRKGEEEYITNSRTNCMHTDR